MLICCSSPDLLSMVWLETHLCFHWRLKKSWKVWLKLNTKNKEKIQDIWIIGCLTWHNRHFGQCFYYFHLGLFMLRLSGAGSHLSLSRKMRFVLPAVAPPGASTIFVFQRRYWHLKSLSASLWENVTKKKECNPPNDETGSCTLMVGCVLVMVNGSIMIHVISNIC